MSTLPRAGMKRSAGCNGISGPLVLLANGQAIVRGPIRDSPIYHNTAHETPRRCPILSKHKLNVTRSLLQAGFFKRAVEAVLTMLNSLSVRVTPDWRLRFGGT